MLADIIQRSADILQYLQSVLMFSFQTRSDTRRAAANRFRGAGAC